MCRAVAARATWQTEALVTPLDELQRENAQLLHSFTDMHDEVQARSCC